MILLYDINDEKLKRLEIEYKKLSDIKLNDTYTEVAPFDSGVYAETPDEIKKLKDFQELDKFAEKMKEQGVPINYAHLSRAFYPLTAICSTELQPNINYIKNIRF